MPTAQITETETIEIFVHLPGRQVAELIKIHGDAEVEILLRRVCPEGHEELDVFIEGEEKPLPKHGCLHEHGIKHHHRLHCRHRHHENTIVEITINGRIQKTHRGKNTVQHLKAIGEVPPGEVLAEFKGEFVDLDDNAVVEICGHEVFASHVKSAGSS